MARDVKRAGSRKTVTAANLAALGVERLAAILVEAAEDEASLKRRLRMELAAEVGADHLAAEVAKNLAAIQGRRSRVHWRKYKAFVRNLDLQRLMIVGTLGELDPGLSLDFLWRFLALPDDVFRQVDDARGQVELVFRAAGIERLDPRSHEVGISEARRVGRQRPVGLRERDDARGRDARRREPREDPPHLGAVARGRAAMNQIVGADRQGHQRRRERGDLDQLAIEEVLRGEPVDGDVLQRQ